MAIKTKNESLAAETRAMLQIAKVLDALPVPARLRVLRNVRESIEATVDQPILFPIQGN